MLIINLALIGLKSGSQSNRRIKAKRDWNELKSPLGKRENVISQRAAQTLRQPSSFEYKGMYGKKGHMFLILSFRSLESSYLVLICVEFFTFC